MSTQRALEGLCVFDIDNTLTRAKYATAEECEVPSLRQEPSYLYGPGVYALEAVQRCKNLGYRPVVATAAHCDRQTPRRLAFLQGLGFGEDVVTAAGAAGPGLQCANPINGGNKEMMVRKLMKDYDMPGERVMFFDDTKAMRHQVRRIPGVVTGIASPGCGGYYCDTACGLQKREFDDAVRRRFQSPQSK